MDDQQQAWQGLPNPDKLVTTLCKHAVLVALERDAEKDEPAKQRQLRQQALEHLEAVEQRILDKEELSGLKLKVAVRIQTTVSAVTGGWRS